MAPKLFEKFRRKKPTDGKANSSTTLNTPTSSIASKSTSSASQWGPHVFANVKSHDPARPSTVTVQEPAPATPRPVITNEDSHSITQAQLWIHAYNAISEDDPKLVAAYKAVLSSELRPEATPNITDPRLQMEGIVQEGLRKTENTANILHKMHDGMRIVSSVKELIGKAAKHAPEAAAAWAGICLLFDVGVVLLKTNFV